MDFSKLTIKTLLENGVDVDKNKDKICKCLTRPHCTHEYNRLFYWEGNTPLQCASKYGHADCIKLLLDNGANVNKKNRWSALDYASMRGHVDCVKLLLDYVVNVNGSNNYYGTPLQLASQFGHNECVKVLLDYSADVHKRYNEDGYALGLALANEHNNCAKTLLESNRIDINKKNNDGRTILHDISTYPFPDGIKILLDYGANFSEKLNKGQTPFDLAHGEKRWILNKWIEDNEISIKEPEQ